MENNILYSVIVFEFGFLHPKQHVQAMTSYYEVHGKSRKAPLDATMRYWMQHYLTMSTANQPDLNENERAVLQTFVEKIDPRLVVRLFEVLQGFTMTPTAIIFRVKPENKDKFATWLTDIDAPCILASYHRTIQVGSV